MSGGMFGLWPMEWRPDCGGDLVFSPPECMTVDFDIEEHAPYAVAWPDGSYSGPLIGDDRIRGEDGTQVEAVRAVESELRMTADTAESKAMAIKWAMSPNRVDPLATESEAEQWGRFHLSAARACHEIVDALPPLNEKLITVGVHARYAPRTIEFRFTWPADAGQLEHWSYVITWGEIRALRVPIWPSLANMAARAAGCVSVEPGSFFRKAQKSA